METCRNEKKRIVLAVFYIAIFTKQFYFLPSGSIGIADLFFAAAGILTLYTAWKNGKKFGTKRIRLGLYS